MSSRFGVLRFVLERSREPVETLVQTVSAGSAGGLDVPLARAKRVQAELIGDLSDRHGVGQVLLVGKNKEDAVTKLVLAEDLLELEGSFVDTLAIVRVDNINNT